MGYRLLGGAQDDIDRILLRSAREWGFDAADRYDQLIRAVFGRLGEFPDLPESQAVVGVPSVRAYSLHLGRRLVGIAT